MHARELRVHAGRLLFVGIPGPALDEESARTLTALGPGGVVLFRRNAGPPPQLAALTASLHALPVRPLIAIDHEGGRVNRLDEPFTRFPPAAAVGRSGDTAAAFEVGRAMAVELSSVGIDLNFAPVLDVHSNPANPVIGDRAFGSDPGLVAAMGTALLRGLRAGGVVACGKHFPGHGDTSADSHLALPVVHRGRAALAALELVPFRAAIDAGVPALMTAHVRYPAFDATQPATLSSAILSKLLRDELRFDGAVMSDDLSMRAIADHQPVEVAAVRAVAAGVDALLVCQDLADAGRARDALVAAVEAGGLAAERLAAAATRVEGLRGLIERRDPVRCALPNPAHRALAARLAAA